MTQKKEEAPQKPTTNEKDQSQTVTVVPGSCEIFTYSERVINPELQKEKEKKKS